MDVLTHFLLPFVAIMLGLLVIHEAGHYFMAKLFGVKVLEAGIGLPPRLWGFRWHDTDYTINALPFGAFVRMLGEEDPSDPQSLAAQPKWKRTITIGAGATMNLLLAIALFAAALMIPQRVSESGAVIGDVAPGSPAEQAGLQPGDEIYKVNGRRAESTQDASYLIHLAQGSTIHFEVKRKPAGISGAGAASELVDASVYARWDPPAYVDECGIKHAQGPTGISIAARNVDRIPLSELSADERAKLETNARKGYLEHRKQITPGAAETCFNGGAFGFHPVREAQCNERTPEEQAKARALKAELFPESINPCYEFRPELMALRTTTRSEPLWEALPHGTRKAFESLILMRNLVWMKIRGFNSSTSGPITGPVGIAQATGEVVNEAGWVSLIELAAGISMSLAVLNFLPIPMVDGGRLMFILIEFLRGGRRIAPEKEALVHLMGFAALLMIALVVTYFDILRLVNGDSLLR